MCCPRRSRSWWSTAVPAYRRPCGSGCSSRSSGWTTAPPADSGLGLAVARGLTEAVGGTLAAEDTPGGGLTMVLSVPRAASTADSDARAAAS